MVFLFIAVMISLWTGCRNESPTHQEEIAGAYTDLKDIGLSLRHFSFELGKPVEELIACDPDNANDVRIVSAEKVLLPLFKRFGRDESFLISRVYEEKVAPSNPQAKTISGKWGSSYNTWCMSADHWQRTKWFVWYSDGEYQGLDFPWVWDKNAKLYGGRVNLLLGDGSCHSVPTNDFAPYFGHARKWIHPAEIKMDEVLKDLRATTPHVRANALSLLGARKETNQIAEIFNALGSDNSVVKHAAEGALVLMGEAVVPALHSQTNSPSIEVRCGVVRALDRIGGVTAVPALAAFLDDTSSSIRKIAVEALTNSNAEAAMPFLRKAAQNSYPVVRATAQNALSKMNQQ